MAFSSRRFGKKPKRSFKRRATRPKRRSIKTGGKRTRRVARKPVHSGTAGFTVETIPVADIGLNSGNPYSHGFNIANFPRALALQPLYRYYRAVKVSWTYETLWNNYTANQNTGTAINQTVPQLYWQMDRTDQKPFLSVGDFQDAGAKPWPLTRKKVISYVPNVIQEQIQDSIGAAATLVGITDVSPVPKRKNAWLPATSISSASGALTPALDDWTYHGHQVIIDQLAGSAATNPALSRVICTVHWQFKDPFISASPQVARVARTPIMSLVESH